MGYEFQICRNFRKNTYPQTRLRLMQTRDPLVLTRPDSIHCCTKYQVTELL